MVRKVWSESRSPVIKSLRLRPSAQYAFSHIAAVLRYPATLSFCTTPRYTTLLYASCYTAIPHIATLPCWLVYAQLLRFPQVTSTGRTACALRCGEMGRGTTATAMLRRSSLVNIPSAEICHLTLRLHTRSRRHAFTTHLLRMCFPLCSVCGLLS